MFGTGIAARKRLAWFRPEWQAARFWILDFRFWIGTSGGAAASNGYEGLWSLAFVLGPSEAKAGRRPHGVGKFAYTGKTRDLCGRTAHRSWLVGFRKPGQNRNMPSQLQGKMRDE